MVTGPTGPTGPAGPGKPPAPPRPQPEATSSGKVKPPVVTRPSTDLSPKIKAQITFGGLLAVAAIVAAAVPQIAEQLGITLPGAIGAVLSMVLLIGRGYQKAGDGR